MVKLIFSQISSEIENVTSDCIIRNGVNIFVFASDLSNFMLELNIKNCYLKYSILNRYAY